MYVDLSGIGNNLYRVKTFGMVNEEKSMFLWEEISSWIFLQPKNLVQSNGVMQKEVKCKGKRGKY